MITTNEVFMSLTRLNQVEAMICSIEDNEPLTSHDRQRLAVLETEADAIADSLSLIKRKDKEERERREQEELELVAKQKQEAIDAFNLIADDVAQLKKLKKWDEMFASYGHEFVSDYEGHDDGTVISFVSFNEADEPQTWETDCSHTKIKYLVNHRIYNKYVR